MQQSNNSLEGRIVRDCAHCKTPTMIQVSLEASKDQFHCTSCGKAIELWTLRDTVLGLAIYGGMLSLLFMDDHLFWALLHVLANPLQEFPTMLKDGVFAPVLIPLGLVLFNILLVGLPLTGLAIIARATYLRLCNPVVKGAAGSNTADDHTFGKIDAKPPFSLREFLRSAMIAVFIHAGFIAVAWLSLTFASQEVFRGIVEGALPGLLLGGGLLFGARRWAIATVWVVLLPVSGFIVSIMLGQSI